MGKKTAELTGAALDWAVMQCEYPRNSEELFFSCHDMGGFYYSGNWAMSGLIIEREKIKVSPNMGGTWSAQIRHTESHPLVSHPVLAGWTNASGDTPLIAAMRCYVASKLGDNVEIPDGLA